MVYSKPAISVIDQIAKLRSRGLSIPDTALAEHFLRNVSYYRLAGYWWTLQSDPRRHRFRRGATFQQVIDRYDFDRELRIIAFDMIERVEVAIRTRMMYHLALTFGPHWYEDAQHVQNLGDWRYNLQRIRKDTTKSSEKYLREHFRKYRKDNRNPPCWKALEIVTMGTLSKMYANLKPKLAQKDVIAQEVGLPDQTYLENWLHGIALIRNIVAHHNRLFQRTISNTPLVPTTMVGKWINADGVDHRSVYFQLSCIAYMLQFISPDNRFGVRLREVFKKYKSTIKFKEVGFPADWRTQPLWQ